MNERIILTPTTSPIEIKGLNGLLTFGGMEEKLFKYFRRDAWFKKIVIPGMASSATQIRVYEPNTEATIYELFSSLSNDLSVLCLSQHQIIEIVKSHRNCINGRKGIQNAITYFLSDIAGSIFVIRIHNFNDCELYVDASALRSNYNTETVIEQGYFIAPYKQ